MSNMETNRASSTIYENPLGNEENDILQNMLNGLLTFEWAKISK